MRNGSQMIQNEVNQDDLHDQGYLYGNDSMGKGMNQNVMVNPMMGVSQQNNGLVMGINTQDEHNMNYYQEYCRLFIANVVLTTQMKELVSEKNELLAKLAKVEQRRSEDYGNNQNSHQESFDDKKKRFRRIAAEIDRHYRCPDDSCQKSYGSEGSLNQHVKLKHPHIALVNPDFKLKLSKKDSNSTSGDQHNAKLSVN